MHFGTALYANIARYDHLELTASYDSMHVVYRDDRMVDLVGFSSAKQDHLQLTYHAPFLDLLGYRGRMRFEEQRSAGLIKQIARLDTHGDLIGIRVDYDPSGQVVRTEHFLVPYKKEEEALGVVVH